MNELKTGDSLHGFTVVSVDDIPEYRGRGIRLKHQVTGLDLYHLHNDDRENLFSFVFKTPASDNTGLAHIMEHCVLAGSEKYPVKDPFLSMMNGSMNTFLNAMTYPDKTVFPAASTVKKDYYNLMSVYADAVFFPLLKKEIFMQEGIRFEPSGDGTALPAGVVFNEMKGSYSNHDSIASEYSYRLLFPDTSYRYDSGGEPAAIPSLTYERFREFHRRYYHPSNCRIFLYGDIPTVEQLEFLQNNVLQGFSAGASAEDIDLQQAWDSPRRETVSCPAGTDGDDSGESGTTITINWKCGSTEDSFNILVFEILTEALMGNMGSPIYKAVVESGIGEDLSPVSGLDTDLRELVFCIGVRGSSSGRIEEFERLVISELEKLADGGIPERSLKGAIHRVEFRNREIRGGAPFGLRLMGRSLKGWLHGDAPDKTMGFEKPIKQLRDRLAENPRFFEELIRGRFIENMHRLTLCVEPEKSHNSRMETEITGAVADARKGFGSEELKAETDDFESFNTFQETPDPPGMSECIPTLDMDDLPREIKRISTVKEYVGDVPVYVHDLFTNGIIYIDFAVDIRDISDEDGMLLPFLSRMICSSGLPGMPYDEVALELALKTGGLYTFLESSRTAGPQPVRKDYLFFRLKTLEKDLETAFSLAVDMMLKSEITDPARVRDLLYEMRNDFKSSVIPAGHSFCAVKAGAQFDRVLEREDEWRGSRQLIYINSLAGNREGIPGLCKSLGQLRSRLFSRERMTFNITCSSDFQAPVKGLVAGFVSGLPSEELPFEMERDVENKPEFSYGALSVPSSVSYTARAIPAGRLGEDRHAHESILAHLLKTNELWESVRMKNGAYGVYASVNGTEGLMTVSTYRDPRPAANLGALEAALSSAEAGRYTGRDLKNAVITVVGRDTKPLSPGEESLIGFRRELYCISDEIRQQKREAMLNCSVEDIAAAAGKLKNSLDKSVSVVMGGDEVIAGIAEKYGEEIKNNIVRLPL